MCPAGPPTREELVHRAAKLVPLLRKHAAWSHDKRRLHDEVIDAMSEAGLFRLRTPRRYGGYECDTETLLAVASELGRADGAAAWVCSVFWIPTWMAAMFPQAVQDEVFATPDARVCGTLSPTAMATSGDEGVTVNGKWSFISGAHHSHWQEIIAILTGKTGEPYPVVALVPMSDLLIVDDWHAYGLSGSGSVSTVAKDVFVPYERVLPLESVLQGQPASQLTAESPIYRCPLLPVAAASSAGTAIGLGRGAFELFMNRLPDRKITYTDYESQRSAPVTHHQVADAAMKLDEAEFHASRLAKTVDHKSGAGAQWKLEERAKARADLGAAVRLTREAVDGLALASGGSSIYQDVPIQRFAHDLKAVNLHALMNPTTNAELYGRVLCGLEANTTYI